MGSPLPYDDVHGVRDRMWEISPSLVRYDATELTSTEVALAGLGYISGKTGTTTSRGQPFKNPISNFYQTDPISRAYVAALQFVLNVSLIQHIRVAPLPWPNAPRRSFTALTTVLLHQQSSLPTREAPKLRLRPRSSLSRLSIVRSCAQRDLSFFYNTALSQYYTPKRGKVCFERRRENKRTKHGTTRGV